MKKLFIAVAICLIMVNVAGAEETDEANLCYWCTLIRCYIYPVKSEYPDKINKFHKEMQKIIKIKCLKNQKERKQKYAEDINDKVVWSEYTNWCKNYYDYLMTTQKERQKSLAKEIKKLRKKNNDPQN